MSINYNNESQFELFPGAPKYGAEFGEMPSQIKSLTLSLENIIVLSIIFIMTLVLFFSFGVEKGKKFVSDTGEVKEDNVTAQIVSDDASVVQDDNSVSKIIIEQRGLEQEQGVPEVQEVPVSVENLTEDIFTIQVASFKRETSAEREVSTLRDMGREAFVLAKGSYSIVCVGKFAQRIEAKEFSSKLKNRYRDLLVRRF